MLQQRPTTHPRRKARKAKPATPPPRATRFDAGAAVKSGLIAVVAVLAFLPVGERLGTTDLMLPDFPALVPMWTGATLLAVALAALASIASRQVWPGPPAQVLTSIVSTRWIETLLLLMLAALVANLVSSRLLFEGFPLNVDEMTQALQARIFASGRFWAPSPPDIEFESVFLMVNHEGRMFAQFPPGWSAMLAVGDLFGQRWVVGPIMGMFTVLAAFLLASSLGHARSFALVYAATVAITPWLVFNAASQMNHTAAMTLVLFACAATIVGVGNGQASYKRKRLALAGCCFGMAALVRPLDAAAFALPAFAWLVWQSSRRRQLLAAAPFVLGACPPLILLLGYNTLTTGHPLIFGYDLQWGAAHGLGFHAAPWGPAHSPERGIVLINKYLLNMQTALFESHVPALLAPLAAIALTRRFSPGDRLLLAGTGLLCFGYFLYWHNGDYLGPRFLLLLAPVAVLWTLRLPAVMAQRTQSRALGRFAALFVVLSCAFGAVRIPAVASAYAKSYPLRRIDVDRLVDQAGVQDAVVFVPSAWSAQMPGRILALGLSPHETEALLQSVEPCLLEEAVARLEAGSRSGLTAIQQLQTLPRAHRFISAEWMREIRAPDAPPPTRRCLAKAQADGSGTWPLPPFLLARAGNNRFVRDLHERNDIILQQSNGPFYVVRPDPVLGQRQPRIVPFNQDSARWAWTTMLWDALEH